MSAAGFFLCVFICQRIPLPMNNPEKFQWPAENKVLVSLNDDGGRTEAVVSCKCVNCFYRPVRFLIETYHGYL